MTRQDGDHRVACATLTYLAEPADPVPGRLLQVLSPVEVLASTRSGTIPAHAARAMGQAQAAGLRPALARWRSQLPRVPAGAALARHAAGGIRLICPGEPGWPPQLDDLGTARPYALWVRGAADLRANCEKSLAVIGARAATAYGKHAASCIAADLADHDWAIISGAAYVLCPETVVALLALLHRERRSAPLWFARLEQWFAVVAAKQEEEAAQVAAEIVGKVGAAAHETGERGFKLVVPGGQPGIPASLIAVVGRPA